MRRSRRLMLVLCAATAGVFSLIFTSQAAAQNTQVERFERQLEQIYRDTRLRADTSLPADQRALIDYGGYITLSFVTVDDLGAETHVLRQSDLNLWGRVNFDGAHEFFARGHVRHRDWNTGDDFDGNGDDTETEVDRLFYIFDLAAARAAYEGEIIDYNVRAKLGRQLVSWGNGLTLSEELDAAHVTLKWKDLSIDLLGGRVQPNITDIDSTRPKFDNDTDRSIWGIQARYQATARHQPYAYFISQNDRNDDDFAVIGGTPTNFEYDSWYAGVGSRGNLGDQLLYGVEMVYQGGETYSSSVNESFVAIPGGQTKDDIEAFAIDFQLDYLARDANRSRVSFEVLIASGDDDRYTSTSDTFGGNAPNTDDHAFNSFGLLNTGVAFAPTMSNLTMLRLGASTYPIQDKGLFERFQVGANVFGFFKTERDGPIDEPTDNESYLGFEADVYLNWQLTSDLALATRYGAFVPGSAIQSGSDVRHFFYTGLTLAF